MMLAISRKIFILCWFLLIPLWANSIVVDTDAVTRKSPVSESGIKVSGVSGHTAFYNAVAEFYVSLESQPSADVVIPISSSNPQEGIPDVESLTFSPDNWRLRQQVIVKGRNPDVQNGEQDYQIILGVADSVDQNYHGIDPEDVFMSGIRLSLIPPREKLLKLIEGNPFNLLLKSSYSGNSRLNYSLKSGPVSMRLETKYGPRLVWDNPQHAVVGEPVQVEVEVTDGEHTAPMVLELTVTSGVLLEPELKIVWLLSAIITAH